MIYRSSSAANHWHLICCGFVGDGENHVTETATTPKNKILLVDDEKSILFAVGEYFEAHGFKVDSTHEVGEASAFLNENRYQVAIVDLCLTRSDSSEGMALVSRIREKAPETRIIILTAFGTSEMEKRALAMGVDAFIRKPKPLAELAQIVFGLVDAPGEEKPWATTVKDGE
jgi:DNA-binding response OmpR family regulator